MKKFFASLFARCLRFFGRHPSHLPVSLANLPWVFTQCEYRGIDEDGCHVYLVARQRGKERRTDAHRFHARGPTHQKSADKMNEYFRNSVAALNEA